MGFLNRLRGLVARIRSAREAKLSRQASLLRRIEALEADVHECRQLNRRLAEVTDLVAEALLPAAGRDDDALRRALADYRTGL
jgi:hypothetical protein